MGAGREVARCRSLVAEAEGLAFDIGERLYSSARRGDQDRIVGRLALFDTDGEGFYFRRL